MRLWPQVQTMPRNLKHPEFRAHHSGWFSLIWKWSHEFASHTYKQVRRFAHGVGISPHAAITPAPQPPDVAAHEATDENRDNETEAVPPILRLKDVTGGRLPNSWRILSV